MSDKKRAALLAAAGLAIMALGAAAALLPAADGLLGSAVIGVALLLAGHCRDVRGVASP